MIWNLSWLDTSRPPIFTSVKFRGLRGLFWAVVHYFTLRRKGCKVSLSLFRGRDCNGGDCERARLCAEPCAGCLYCDERGNL